jgi:hypothetical protein
VSRRSAPRRWPLLLLAIVSPAALAAAAVSAREPAAPHRPQDGAPVVTLLYQNFPNPFPAGGRSSTCLWFDLHRTSPVRLTIHGVRGNVVRTLIPAGDLTGTLPAGRYGRGANASSCDPRLSWDGRADDGTLAPSGVYLARLRTQTHESFKKMLFRGQ